MLLFLTLGVLSFCIIWQHYIALSNLTTITSLRSISHRSIALLLLGCCNISYLLKHVISICLRCSISIWFVNLILLCVVRSLLLLLTIRILNIGVNVINHYILIDDLLRRSPILMGRLNNFIRLSILGYLITGLFAADSRISSSIYRTWLLLCPFFDLSTASKYDSSSTPRLFKLLIKTLHELYAFAHINELKVRPGIGTGVF